MGKRQYAGRTDQWRAKPDFLCDFGGLLLRRAQKTDGIDGTGGLTRQHGQSIARWAPGELLRSARVFVQGFDVLQSLDGASAFIDHYVPARVQDPATERIQESVQSDVVLQARRERQTTGDA